MPIHVMLCPTQVMAVDNPPYREPMLALRHAMTVRPATPLAMPYRSDKHLGKHTMAAMHALCTLLQCHAVPCTTRCAASWCRDATQGQAVRPARACRPALASWGGRARTGQLQAGGHWAATQHAAQACAHNWLAVHEQPDERESKSEDHQMS